MSALIADARAGIAALREGSAEYLDAVEALAERIKAVMRAEPK